MRASFSVALALILLSPACLAAGQPSPVLVADVSAADAAQHQLAVSLQGLANRQAEGPGVFLLTNPRDEEWLQYCLRLSPRPIERVTVEGLLERLKPQLKGQILYDPKQAYTINIATTAAGLRQAAISPTDLGLPTLLDLRQRWSSASEANAWAQGALLRECARDRAAFLPPDVIAMRDFAIQQGMFVFSAPSSPEEPGFREALVHFPPGTPIYGEVPTELQPALSQASHYIVWCGYAANLSFFAHLDAGQRFYQYPRLLDPTAPRYLALIFDCSDLSFAVNNMPGVWERWGRGSVPLGWALPAGLLQAAPPVLRRYYADAYRSGLDDFVLGPTGAGDMNLSAASAPYAFLEATARAAAALDAHTALFWQPGAADLAAAVTRFASDAGLRGVFVLGAGDFAPALYGGVPVVAAPWTDRVQAAISYLDRIPLERRFAALSLDPRALGPADAAHIAAHVARRFVVVTPQELAEVMRIPALPSQPGGAAAAVTSVDYPDPADAEAPIPVKAVVAAPAGLLSADVAYRTSSSPLLLSRAMQSADDSYRASLPPIRSGGELTLSVRAVDAAGRAAWSPSWTLQVPRADADGDGLSDAEERFLLTDGQAADSDGDGLSDAGDPTPLREDRITITYFGPLHPPSDLPYLTEPGASQPGEEGRVLAPAQSCTYWLPLYRLPRGAPAVIALEAEGPASLALSGDAAAFSEQFTGDLTGIWHSEALPADLPGGIFLRITCPAGASRELLVRGLAVCSPPGAPSIGGLSLFPLHPGPEQPITAAAAVFSPKGISQVSLTYRINERGEISLPMVPLGGSQRYQAVIPALDNRDQLEWWITARDGEGREAATVPEYLPIGSRARESVALTTARDFAGEWLPSADWNGAGRVAPQPGLRDSADANLSGGVYLIWVLAAGRGQGIGVYVGDRRVGRTEPDRPDGWQQVGRIRLDAARHHLHLISEAAPRAPAGASPRHGGVILSSDPTFQPPADRPLDIYNSLALLSPRAGDTLTGRVELRATAAGNVIAVELSLDGRLLRRVSGPPFSYTLNTGRIGNGPHLLKAEGFDLSGTTGLVLEIPVTIAN